MVPVVEALIRRNVRYPDTIFGDLNAQIACGKTAAGEMVALLDKYGRGIIVKAMDELMNRAEMQTRKEIEKIPDGTYRFTDWLDNDGIELNKRINITVAVTIEGSEIHADFTGTSPQVRGPLNAVPSCTLSAVRYVVRVVTGSDISNNEGCYRMIRLTIPEKSVLNPRRPAPVNSRAVTLRRVVDTTLGAFAQALSGRLPAANNGHPLHGHFGGIDDATGKSFILSEMGTGGMGARPTKDGIDCLCTDTSNAKNIPVEIGESSAPLRIQYYRVRTDSGGAGRYRGGCGFEKEYICLMDNVVLAHCGERHYTRPWGQAGGKPAASSVSIIIRADESEEIVPSKQTIYLNCGDRIIMRTAGGGGYGNPLERPAKRVVDDVLNLKVSPEAAQEFYGIVIQDGVFHGQETARLRKRLAERGKNEVSV